MIFIKVVFFLLVLYVSAYSEDSYPFIPDSNSSFVRFDEKDYIQYEKRIETPVVYYYDSEEAVFIFNETGIQDKNKPANNILTVYISSELANDGSYRKLNIPEYFFNAAGYYSVSVNPGVSGAVTGGFAAGFTVGIDKFLETGVIDIGTSARVASLMAASSYMGSRAGAYAANTLTGAAFSGGAFSEVLRGASGGVAAGMLFAGGAFITGAADRHEMRMIAVKSAVGSSASAGASAIIGASAGGFILPYAVALGTVFFVEKTFKAFDKQEEKEKLELLLHKIVY